MIRQLWQISVKLNNITLKTQMVHACILSRTDYCNSLYIDLPKQEIKKLQRLMNAAVRFIFNIKRRRTLITPYL